MTASVLIVEDEALVALQIEETLLDAGFSIAGVAGEPGSALDLIAAETVDVAILDANLDGRSAAPVAERLRALGKPFLVVTGYSADQIRTWLGDAPLLGKPFDPDRLVREVRRLNAGTGR